MTRILLIEDEPAIADTLAFALRREGFEVDWRRLARDGEAALPGAALVILDVGLPDDSGFEVLKRIRRQGEVPVLMLTARADEVDRIVGLELGADDYVVKPFSPREVVARVRAILKRTGARVATTAPATALEHDAAARRLRYRGHWLALTPSEYRVLALLASAPGRVFSRAQLLDALGEAAEDSFERVIDSHVKSVRAKLREIAPDDDPIETHRGFGYSLKDGG
ncbi:DNA-binding response regulator [Chitiniphilus shinanonensis]|uniref:DNA-binding response regulator n=1 Tax=Chitiniphilus shinanonensis TaxID=553088 RepID=A0ABQ6BMI8_9NEIS|nr:two-component system response regulator CreB [Chitiniphilus shinanonensis]GLS02864.1 DNA-binding response regulator [Chitiniphilus shinanonensis]